MWFLEIENRANKKKELPTLWLKLLFCCRDYWTRTSDLAPPRRVRYQLRYIPRNRFAKVYNLFYSRKYIILFLKKK